MSKKKFQIQEIVEEEVTQSPTGEKITKRKRIRSGTLLIGGLSFPSKQAISMLGKGLFWLGKTILIPPLIFIQCAVNYTGTSIPVDRQDNAIGPKTTVEEKSVKISVTIAMNPEK
jgi:hypothetical protein